MQPPHTLRAFGDSSVIHPLPFVFGTHPFDGKLDHFHTNLAELSKKDILENVRTVAQYAFDLLDEWRTVDPDGFSQASPKLNR